MLADALEVGRAAKPVKHHSSCLVVIAAQSPIRSFAKAWVLFCAELARQAALARRPEILGRDGADKVSWKPAVSCPMGLARCRALHDQREIYCVPSC